MDGVPGIEFFKTFDTIGVFGVMSFFIYYFWTENSRLKVSIENRTNDFIKLGNDVTALARMYEDKARYWDLNDQQIKDKLDAIKNDCKCLYKNGS